MEYEEIIGRHLGEKLASNVLQLIENAPNVEWITNYYRWELVKADSDDNKFVDCAIACNAAYLVSNDRHFQILTELGFPKVNLLSAEEFIEQIKTI